MLSNHQSNAETREQIIAIRVEVFKMAAPIKGFDEWLFKKLQALNTDPEAFGDYIKGILDGDDSMEEKKEAIEEILGEFMEEDIQTAAAEILQEWDRIQSKLHQERQNGTVFDIDKKLASIMEKQAQCVVKEKTITAEEKASRQALLVKYGQVSDGEDSDEDIGKAIAAAPATVTSSDLLVKNINSELVALNQKEQREQAKADHEKKKVNDKLSREQQKQKAVDRKDKEKKRTQKGERRR